MAYLAGLGTTGVLIASVLLLMLLGTGFVAFEGVPDFARADDPLARVVVYHGTLGSDGSGEHRELAAADRYRPASHRLAAEQRQGAVRGREAAGRRAARRRAARGHGGAQVRAGDRLGGGAGAGGGSADGGGPSGGSGGSPGGQPAPLAGGGGSPEAEALKGSDPCGLRRG